MVTATTEVDQRLSELMADFWVRSKAKSPSGGWAEIHHDPPHEAWGGWPLRLMRYPDRWSIVYFDRDGQVFQFGFTIGTTKAAAIRWLLNHRRTWSR